MTPDPAQDHSGLRWIRGELDETLRKARLQLEDFVDEETTSLDECIRHLHHVHGSLELLQIYGGAMLADELEKLARGVSEGKVDRQDAAAEVLMLGMVQLPAYLERIEAGEPDIPLVLLPLMNDLRASRGAPLVSEASLFAPKLDSVIAAEEVLPGSGNPALGELVAAQRPHFHKGLLNWFRGADSQLGLRQVRDVIEQLNSQARTARLRRLFDASEALTAALYDQSLESSGAVKQLFGQLDRVFKRIIDDGEEAAARDFPIELLKNQLYYIARSDSDDPVVMAVRQSADLANSFPDMSVDETGQLGGPGKELFDAVGDALRNDLMAVKDQLDLYMRGSRADLTRLRELIDPVRRIGDTLGMVGRGELRSRLMPHCERLGQCVESEQEPDEDQLMGLAGDLLFVESSLSGLADGPAQASPADGAEGHELGLSQAMSNGEFKQHVEAAISQATVELAKTKDAILQFLSNPQEPGVLASSPQSLHAVSGALTVLEQPQAAALLEMLADYLAELASGQRDQPDHEQREALADLVSGVEYHMESVVERKPDFQNALAFAQAASQKLGLGERESLQEESAPEEPVGTEEPAGTEEPIGTDDLQVQASSKEEAASATGEQPLLDDIDSEILDIFIEEAREELQAIRESYPQWRANADAEEPLTRMRRAFHTLKGSGRLVGASQIGEFAWSIENLLNRVIDRTIQASGEVLELMDEVVEVLPVLIDEREHGATAPTSVDGLEKQAFLLASPAPVDAAETSAETPVSEDSLESSSESAREPAGARESESDEEGAEILLPESSPASTQVTSVEADIELEPVATGEQANEPDSLGGIEMLELPEAGEEDPLDVLSALDELDLDVDEGSRSDKAESVSESPVEPQEPGPESLLSVDSAFAAIGLGADIHPDDDALSPEEGEPVEAVEEVAAQDSEPLESILTEPMEADAAIELESGLHDVFVNEARIHLDTLERFIENCRGQANGCVISNDLERSLHTLRGSSHMAGVSPMATLAGSMENWVNVLSGLERRTDATIIDLLERGHFVLGAMLNSINEPGSGMPSWEPLQREFAQQTEGLHQEVEKKLVVDEVEHLDDELVGIFLEEANELSEGLEVDFGEWEARPDDLLPVAQLQRHLHTIKGGARMAELSPIGDLAHAMESLFESFVERRVEANHSHQQLARHALDAIAGQIEALTAGRFPQAHEGMVERLELAARGGTWEPVDAPMDAAVENVVEEPAEEPTPEEPIEAPAEDSPEMNSALLEAEESADDASELTGGDSSILDDSNLLTDSELLGDSMTTASMLLHEGGDGGVGAVLGDDSRIIQFPARGHEDEEGTSDQPVRRPPPPPEESAEPAGSQETIRVRADLLDMMVNNAGEVSIYRARLEQQNKTFGYNLEELSQTIERLRNQLRNLELETEAQILSRYERENEGEIPAGFDPLEMDQYSNIQELSRALSETVNDLSSLGDTLADMNRDSDTLLVQQERVNNDLQDGLLRTRMVPVASQTSRLHRVVRQTAHSLGKKVELSVLGGEGEMDRAILERMMAPLEHLLRNAVAHGLETPKERLEAEKPEQGTVSLVVSREGADVVLTVSDDGRGFDREAIRAKAIQRGLIESGAQIEDEDLDQMVLEAGFSTADEVSQISGRGVGMDVVLSEVKQLGGSLELDSQPGRGCSFTIRLPFTLAITEALLVTSGEEVYAVPHSAMDGVVRISREDLEACYRGEKETFTYDGRDYLVRYLGSMLGNAGPLLPEGDRWFPVLLVHSGEHRVAIHVDTLLGNRQIVIKSVGVQLSTVRWFTGGTILADGRIALILDVNSLVRLDSTQHAPVLQEEAQPEPHSVKVMVVDDSITVRKVTARLLERHNMQVITAKDGVDAVAVLQEEQPDVMLLDIEMPRMDGFELARHMRSTEELKHVPIIMITSRTGDKHRAHATELGVKRYLGKPYQEADLLENIYTVLAESEDA